MHVDVTAHPTAAWVWRQLIQATPWGTAPRFLLRDRDRSYGQDFALRAAKIAIKAIQTPVQAPKENAVVERVIGTLRRECTDHIIVLNHQHLRSVLREYITYYNDLRPHRSLVLETPIGPRALPAPSLRTESPPTPSWAGCITSTGGPLRADGIFVPHRFPVAGKDRVLEQLVEEQTSVSKVPVVSATGGSSGQSTALGPRNASGAPGSRRPAFRTERHLGTPQR